MFSGSRSARSSSPGSDIASPTSHTRPPDAFENRSRDFAVFRVRGLDTIVGVEACEEQFIAS
jgi:hypothetical protein